MSDSIQVAIKVRPLIKREKDENLQIQWTVVDNVIAPTDSEKKRGETGFQFDHIFDHDKTNSDVFETVVKPIVDAAVNGFNGTVFAYGQTSSGKTYTMLGTHDEPGVIPMAVERMFDSIGETCGREFLLRVSYLEIYNEKVNDLLDTTGVDLKLREDNNGLVQVTKCKEEIASSPDVIMSIMKKGDKNRRIGETDMNERSSRSHTIFRITIESRDLVSDSDGAIQVSQLNLVDLAGSERARQTNATGERFKEGTHINMSLSTLGLVIKQLSESSDGSKYINFRDSKLTRLLQASLGGNAMTTIICAVTPAAFEETQCTLSFASRAKSVKNKPQLNEVMSDAALLKRYKRQLSKLNEELERLKNEKGIAEVQEMESKLQEKEHKLQETDRINQLLEERIELLKNSIVSAGSVPREETTTKLPRSLRRRTWGGDRALNSRFSLCMRNLPTIKEISATSPESKFNSTGNLISNSSNNIKKRKSIMQTCDLNNESFETEFADFELELIQVAKEREEFTDTMDFIEDKVCPRIKPKNENRVKFQDNVEVFRLSTESNWSTVSTPEKQQVTSKSEEKSQGQSASPGTPKSVLRERLSYLTDEYKALQEFTTLERQMLSAQKLDFDSPNEKIYMQQQIEELIQRLQKYSSYQSELEEQLTISLNCINSLSSNLPEILELWKPSLFSEEKREVNTYNELKQLLELLKTLENKKESTEKSMTPLEEKLTNDYNECMKELEQVQHQKESLFQENGEIKKKLLDESNKLKNANILIDSLRGDTDCLMEKLIEKNSELAKLKEKVVELERVSHEIEKSISLSPLEVSVKTENIANVSIKPSIGNEFKEDKDIEIARLNEIVEEKSIEIAKHRQFEEDIKTENESLQQTLDAILKIERKSQECQTEICDDQSEKEVPLTNTTQDKDAEIERLMKVIEEQAQNISQYQQLETEMNTKIEDMQQSLNVLNAEQKSQDTGLVETGQISNSKDNNTLVLELNIEISRLTDNVKEKADEIIKHEKLQKQLQEEILKLQNSNTGTNAEQISVACQTSYFHSPEDDKLTEVQVEKDLEITRLECIIQEKTSEISRFVQSEEEAKKEILRLQHCLNSINEAKKESQTQISISNGQNDNKEVAGLLEIIQLKSDEIEKYRQSDGKLKKDIDQLQQELKSLKKVSQTSEECETVDVSVHCYDSNKLKEKNDEITKHLAIIAEKNVVIEKYKQIETELLSKIEELQNSIKSIEHIESKSSECQTEFKTSDDMEFNLAHQKLNEEEMKKELEQLKQQLNSALQTQQKSEDTQTKLVLNEEENVTVAESKDQEICRLSKIIDEKNLEIDSCKQLEEKLKKKIERLQECVNELNNTVKQVTEKVTSVYESEKIARELEVSNQIKVYAEENELLKSDMETLKKKSLTETKELEERVTLLNSDLAAKIKDLEELQSANLVLQDSMDKKTKEILNLQQVFDIKVKELEEQMNIIVQERNDLKKKIDWSENLSEDFAKESANLKTIIEKLKTENESLKKRMQLFEADIQKDNLFKIVPDQSQSPKKSNTTLTDDNANVSVKDSVVKDVNQSVSTTSLEDIKDSTEQVVFEVNEFVKPADISTIEPKESKAISNETVTASSEFVKPVVKKLELESSSIFANQTYFDNMEVSITQEFTSVYAGIDESRDISNMTSNIDTSVTNQVAVAASNKSLVANNSIVCNTATASETSVNVSKSEDIQSESMLKLANESITIEEFKVLLEKENARLRNDLQKKIQETEEVQGVIVTIKKNLEDLQQTVYILTNENMEMSKQLTETRENNNQHVISLRKEIDTLQDRILMISEEKSDLRNELAMINEQFENARAATPVITDDEMKNKFFEYQDKIKSLTEENIELSTNLMDKIEELEKVKESKIQLYDHQCTFRETAESLTEQVQCLEKENIELSSELTEQIEECDKLKETADVLKQQLEAYTNQQLHDESNKDDLEFLKQENARLTNELIEVRSKLTQVSRENANLSSNLLLDNSDEMNVSGASCRKSLNATSATSEISVTEGSNSETDDVSTNKKIKILQDQVEHLTLLNKKLSEMSLTNCNQCSHLKELNDSRRQLKLEVKSLNLKLHDLQKQFEKKCADTEILRIKAHEDLNTSLSFIDSTLNGSLYEGINVTVLEDKVKNLNYELEELKENHNKLSNQYNEKCNELEKLQVDNIEEKKGTRRKSDTPTRKSLSRLQNFQRNLDKLNTELQELKSFNTNVNTTMTKLMAERNEANQELESLKLENEKLRKEFNIARGSESNYEEKIKLLDEELTTLYKRLETASTLEKEIHAQNLELQVQSENLLKDKSEFTSAMETCEENFKKDLVSYKTQIQNCQKENESLKEELQKLEDIIQQLKNKNNNYIEDKLREEIDSAKSRMIKEIKSLTNLSDSESKELPKKSVTDVFLSFVNTIVSKETEIIKKIQEEFERNKKKLIEEKQQSIDAEKRTNVWAKTLETDLDKLQNDLTEQENKNKRLRDEIHRIEENLKEAHHENQQLHATVSNLESDLTSCHHELDKRARNSVDRETAINAVQEKERLARTKEEEWEERLSREKEERIRMVEDLHSQLDSYKSINEDLRSTVEGLDLEIEHLKNTIIIKADEYSASIRQIKELQHALEQAEEINQQLKIDSLEKDKQLEENITLMKVKCDLLTEYKNKVETMKPEYESLQAQVSERMMLLDKSKEEVNVLKLEHKKLMDVWQDKLNTEEIKSAGLNKQLVDLKNKNTNLCSTIEEFKDKCSELEREVANLQRKVRNSTSKIRVENEMQELQDENRSLKNHLEGSYNRIKELQETKSQVQRELTEALGKIGMLEQELNTTQIALESLRDKYNNMNLQKLRDSYELLMREKNNITLEFEEKKMLLANKDQKLVEFGIEIDTLRKQKEIIVLEKEMILKEKLLLEDKIKKLEAKFMESDTETDKAYKLVVEEKNRMLFELEKSQKQISELEKKNKELDEEMDDLVTHIHKQENEIAELHDRLITGSSDGNLEKLKSLEDVNEKLRIDLRVTELNYTKLQNEVIRLNSEKESLQSRIEDLNSIIGELESKNSSRNSSKSNSPNTQKGRRRHRRSDIYNKNRTFDNDSDSKDVTDTESPTVTPTPPIKVIQEECQTCYELRNRIREMSLDLVSRNSKITVLEMQLQSNSIPLQMKCNELQDNLLAAKTRISELKLEVQKLQRALLQDSSRECQVCRHKKFNRRDQSVQASPEHKICLTGMSSGLVEDHIRLEKMEKERNVMKDLCRNRARKIKELEHRIAELEGLKD